MPATPRPDWTPPLPATDETRASAAASRTDPRVTARRALQDKARSLLRGLEHVQSCRAGDACGSALCRSTRRLLRTYATHECARRAKPDADCRACRLWQLLMAETARKPRASSAGADDAPPVARPLCGLSALARHLSTRAPPASIRRRVLVAAREAAASRRA